MMKQVLLLLFALLINVGLSAQKSEIKRLEAQRKKALHEITNTDKLLQNTKKTTSNILNRISILSQQISNRKNVVDILNKEVEEIDKEQVRIEQEIMALGKDLEGKRESYAKAIDGMLANRRGRDKILYVLSGKSMSESYRRFHYLKDYSEWRSQQANEIKAKNEELKTKESELAKAKYEKVALLGQRGREQENLQTEEENYQREAKEGQAKQAELQKQLNAKRKQAQDLDRRIEKLIAEEVAKQEREAKRRAQIERERAAAAAKALAKNKKEKNKKTTTTVEPKAVEADSEPLATESSNEDVKLSGNFAANKGRLPYPVSGNASIVTRFGTHQHKEWKVTTSSNGIDIQSQQGASARVVFDGEVSRIVAFPGYNNCVIVRHGNYYTFYGNIQTVSVKQGDRVKTGQLLGVVYTDPDTSLSLMQFQLWQGTSKLNPEPWLR